MNSFDIAVYLVLAVAVIAGFRAGLLRSGVTILGYLLAMPIAVWATSLIVPQIAGNPAVSMTQNSLIFFASFVVVGIVLGTLLRMAVNDMIGSDIGLGDRLGGAALGAIRVFLIAVTMVLIFDQLIPPTLQPAFLVGSQLRPMLSAAGQKGFKSLPPEATAMIDQFKRDHRI
ncbi:MAG: Colicin production protein [Tardiphaga sp.]|jgi:membrane protein required for colicin V production|nr:Colicin production protein [Tardiphaga sp.]